MRGVKQYTYNLALGLDQWINTLLLGDPDESISGRTGRAMASGFPKWWVPTLRTVVDWIFLTFFGEHNHCANAVEREECPAHKELWPWSHGGNTCDS